MSLIKRIVTSVLMISAPVANYGCTSKEPVRIVQICLRDEKGLLEFKTLVKAIAVARHMRYIDSSLETQQALKAIRRDLQNEPFINLAIERSDGMGLTASNLDLPGYQVGIGFSGGSERSDAIKFSDYVTGVLSGHWTVQSASTTTGAVSLKNCTPSVN